MEVGKPVRVLKGVDLGDQGKVEKGAVGILESMSNSVYMPFLVKFPQGTFAFEDGELEDVDDGRINSTAPAHPGSDASENMKRP